MAIVRTLIGNVKGVKGDTGATGAQGNAGEITIGSVTTGSYGTPASVTNSGTATDAVLDFVIPQGAPGETVTDASPLTASTITTATAQYPTYTAGETLAVILGKISKFFSDIRTNGLFKGNLVNGFTQTTPNENALDAAAGKTLNDSISSLNTSFTNLGTRVGGFSTFSFTLSGSGTQRLTVNSDARFAIVYSGRYVTHQGMTIFGSNASGTMSKTDIVASQHVHFDIDTANRVTVSNGHASNAARCLVIMFTESPSVSM